MTSSSGEHDNRPMRANERPGGAAPAGRVVEVVVEPLQLRPATLPDKTGFAAASIVDWPLDVPGPRQGVLGDHRAGLPSSLSDAVPGRAIAFLSGRLCAMRAAQDIGVALKDIPRGPSGEPVWPDGLTASISHSGRIACALAVRREGADHIGLDLEEISRAGQMTEIASLILTAAEMRDLPREESARGETILAVFCLKEAIYKAIHPIVGRFVDYTEVSLHPDLDGTWHARPCPQLRSEMPGWDLALTIEVIAGHFLAICRSRFSGPA